MSQLDISTWPNHEQSRFVLSEGIRWHVQQMGTGPTLLLIHGTGASTHSWRNVMPRLARHFSVTAVDLPGHGFTDSVSGAMSSIPGMSASLGALFRTMKIRPDYCVGHSAGAVILCKMTLDGHIAPQAIISINGAFIPLGGMASHVFSPVARLLASNSLVSHLVARSARTHASVARLIAGTGSILDEQSVELYARLVRSPRHVAGALRMMGNWNLREFERELPHLQAPLTLMVGDRDLMVPPEQALSVQRRIPHAAVFNLPGLGHLAHEEQPMWVAEQVAMICRGQP